MSDKKRVVEKIRKLLAMAEQNASPNEAMIAAAKARELLNEYNLSQEDVILNDSTINEKECSTGRQRMSDWLLTLAQIVAQNFECDHFISGNVGLNKQSTKYVFIQSIVFVGVEEDAEIAGHVFLFLYRLIQNAKTRNKTQFAYGFAAGVGEKLQKEAVVPSREAAAKRGALVVAKKAMVKSHMDNKTFGGTIGDMKSSFDTDHDEFNAGFEEGLNCEITPAVKGGSPEHSQLQLEA